MDKATIERLLKRRTSKTGEGLKFQDVKRLSKMNGLSRNSVLETAKGLTSSGDLKISDSDSKINKNLGIYQADPGMKNFLDGLDSFETIKYESGYDSDKGYKGEEQAKLNDAIRDAGEQFERPQLSDENLYQRMKIQDRTKDAMKSFDSKYGSRLDDSGQLKMDQSGKEYSIDAPKFKNIGKGKNKTKKLRKQFNSFAKNGGYKPLNMTSKGATNYKRSGKDLLKSLGV